MTYLILKAAHVISASVLLGLGVACVLTALMARRAGDFPGSMRLITQACGIAVLPAVALQIATGIALALKAGLSPFRGWLFVSLVLSVISEGLWRMAVEGMAAPSQYIGCGIFAVLIAAAIFVLMILKPDF